VSRAFLSPEELAQVSETLRSEPWSRIGDDWPAPSLDRLEAAWAAEHQTAHAVALSSGTAALTLVLRALGLPPGDEVLIPAFGCPAVDVAVLSARLTPIHVDLDPHSYCISPTAAAAALGPRTGALVAVHFAGQSAGLGPLRRVANRAGIALIEDACLAPGAQYQGSPVGARSHAAVFSLGVDKPITAGEGGVATTNDAALAGRLRRLRGLGADPQSGEITGPSGNYRLSALQAAVALPQLRRLATDTAARARRAERLCAAVGPRGELRPLAHDPLVTRHAHAQFWLRVSADGAPRERLVDRLQNLGLPIFHSWAFPSYCHPIYLAERAGVWLRERESGRDPCHYERTRCPVAERAALEEAVVLAPSVFQVEEDLFADFCRILERGEG